MGHIKNVRPASDMFNSVAGIKQFGPGVSMFRTRMDDMPRPGDFFLTHQKDRPWFPPAFAVIRLGQRLAYRGEKSRYAYWNHAGLFVHEDGATVEALNSGVVSGHIGDYTPWEYTVVYMDMDDRDREQVSEYAIERIGDKYGWLVIANVAARLLLPKGKLSYHVEGQDICSGLVANSLRAAGYTFKGYDPNRIMPADLAYLAGVDVPQL